MKKTMQLKRIRNHAILYLRKSSPTILSIAAIAGLAATSFLVGRATVKTMHALDEIPQNYKETKTDIAIAAVPYYIPAILTGAATVTCILGANALNKKNQALLVSAYEIVNQTYKNYRNKVIELHGKEMDDEIVNEMVRENCEFHRIGINTPDQKVIFYEPFSERCVEMYERELIDAEYHLNRNFVLGGSVSLNDLYDMLGLEHTNLGDAFGWSLSSGIQWIDFEHHLMEEDDGGTPIYSIDTPWGPWELEWWER